MWHHVRQSLHVMVIMVRFCHLLHMLKKSPTFNFGSTWITKDSSLKLIRIKPLTTELGGWID